MLILLMHRNEMGEKKMLNDNRGVWSFSKYVTSGDIHCELYATFNAIRADDK